MNSNTGMILGGGQAVGQADDSPFLVFKLSWVAYVSMIWTVVMRVLVFALAGVLSRQIMIWATGKTLDYLVSGAVIIAVVSMIYDFLYLRSVALFTDEAGVWMQSGVFPWEKGAFVVKWRDVSEATFQTGLLSWALRSYSVRVGHRFTNGAELNVRNVYRGDLAVKHINQVLVGLVGRI